MSACVAVCTQIFEFFYCYHLNDDISVLVADYSVSCTSTWYYMHYFVSVILVIVIPVGIPCYIFLEVFKARPAILKGEGPHHLENIYKDYKKESCLWEVYRKPVTTTRVHAVVLLMRCV